MSISHWLVAGAIFIIFIFIILGIGWWIRNHPSPPPLNKYSAPLTWGPQSPGPDPNKNQCQLYTFPPINVNGKIYPGNPTFNTVILNSLTGSSLNNLNSICTDIDQLYAGEVQHECTAPFGIVDNQISLCRLLSGGVTGLGGSEVFYSNAFCPTQIPCAGQLAVIALDYHPNNPLNCIQNTDQNPIIMPCDPSNANQLFRVTRTAIGVNPTSLSSSSPQNGLLAQIYDRNTGLCLGLGSSISSTIYTPSTNISCTGTTGTNVFNGPNVILTSCTGITGSGTGGATGALYPGFNWAFFPSMRYCKIIGGGCGGSCSGSCNQCYQIFNDNACTGPSNCYDCNGTPYLITPPQIAYIADVNITQLPYGNDASYSGLSGSNATVQWLIDNNVKSLYYGGYGEGFILKPFGLNAHWCPDASFASQYLNIATYNTISQENICYADGLNSSACINF
jgi:hypothetical protein